MKENPKHIVYVVLFVLFVMFVLPWACSPDYSFEPDFKLGAPRY